MDRGAAGPARARHRRARRGDRGLRAGRRPGRPRLDRRPRAGHPPRREGAHRGVQRARRARARAQGHDQPRPHRERRAAADPAVAGPRARPVGRRARPPGPPRRPSTPSSSWPGAATTSPRRPPRWASGSRAPPTRCSSRSSGSRSCAPATRCAASRARWAPRRTCSTCSAATPASWPSWRSGSRRTSASPPTFTSVGQVYPRSLDFDVVSALLQLAAGPSSLATTIRLMAGFELATEGFRPGQVGSSAMPHKMNSRSTERINGMMVLLRGYAGMVGELAGAQWNEGDVSDSVVRRVALPDAFLALDGLFETMLTVLDELRRLPGRDRPRAGPLPAVPRHHRGADGRGARGRRPGDRARGDQGARRGVALAMREKGQAENDLLARLAADERLGRPQPRRAARRPAAVHRRRHRAGRGRRPAGRRDRRRRTRTPPPTPPEPSCEAAALRQGPRRLRRTATT